MPANRPRIARFSVTSVNPLARPRRTAVALLSATVAFAFTAACTTASDDDATTTPASPIRPLATSLPIPPNPLLETRSSEDPMVHAPLCPLAGPPVTTPDDPDVLVYAQEFDGSAIDPLEWNIGDGYKGHGDLANTTAADKSAVHDGVLAITTDRSPAGAPKPYVSGYIDGLGKYARTYGKVELRARFPRAIGVWYAMWGRPWSQPFPEIDIEILNRPTDATSRVYFVNHWAAPPLPADDRRSYVTFTEDVSAFHVYAIVWKPDSLEWHIDGVPKMTAKPQGIPNLPVYWIINGWVGGWAGMPDETTPFPNAFEVDYLRVYRIGGLVADPRLMVRPRASGAYARRERIEVTAANFDEACVHVTMIDGDTPVLTSSSRPYRFPLAKLKPGPHSLTFTATDGVRQTATKLDVRID